MIQARTQEGSRPIPPAPAIDAIPTIRQVLFPSDLSVESDLAFDHALLLAESFGARMTLYHVVEVSHEGAPTTVEEEVRRRVTAAGRQHLELRAQALSGPYSVVVEQHIAVRSAITAHIRDHHPDLIVMATHDRGGLAHMFRGSITQTVIESGRCPVVCLRQPEHGTALPY